jgi:hypothetical protein
VGGILSLGGPCIPTIDHPTTTKFCVLRDARDDCSGKIQILSSFARDFGKLEMLLALDIYLTYGVTNNNNIMWYHKCLSPFLGTTKMCSEQQDETVNNSTQRPVSLSRYYDSAKPRPHIRAKTGSFIEVQNRKCPALNCHDSS